MYISGATFFASMKKTHKNCLTGAFKKKGSNVMTTVHIKRAKKRAWLSFILLPVIVITTLIVTGGAAPAEEINDIDITLEVRRRLQNDDGVSSEGIEVSAKNGIVTLKGSVEHLLARDRAVDIVATIKGIRSVINLLDVAPVARTDDQIRADVMLALLDNPATDLIEIDIAVSDGRVTLAGKVDSWQEEQLCVMAAKSVIGVKDLKSQINVSYKPNRPDQEIKADINNRLAYDVWVDDARIAVKVVRGHVILSGAVGSLAEKKRASRNAYVAGVKSIEDDRLQVEWFFMRDRMRRSKAYGVKSDDEIAKAVNTSFSYDPRLSPSRIIVTVNNGIATLAGKVDNFKARRIAEEDARNTFGVWMVKNHLTVEPDLIPEPHPKPYRDIDLAKTVRLALLRNPYTHQHKIGVNVNNHRVMLDGTVRNKLMKAKAEDVASGVKGVVVVINNIKVERNWTPKNDSDIKTDIENELWWSVFVDEDDIAVTVKQGVATLVGVVDTLRERRAATVNAEEGGAKKVRNLLSVRYGPASLRP